MKTEGTIQESTEEHLRFDAHEFDGLRDDFNGRGHLIEKADRFVRENPWTCLGLALIAGWVLGKAINNR